MFKMQISTEADTKNKNDATDKKGTSWEKCIWSFETLNSFSVKQHCNFC